MPWMPSPPASTSSAWRTSTGEMGDLVRSFNHMASDLETSRQLAQTAQAQLTAANLAVEERRRELETIVETIPSGVVTLDGAGVVLQANRAFAALMGLRLDAPLAGESIASLLPADCAEELATLIRRANRMGAASTELEFHAHGRTLHLAITSARLNLGRGKTGSVLVVEDTTDFLRAQRQLAWKEVAQQVAHEIKNPLTPIALSADRIARHLDRGHPDSPNIIRKCSEVILGCVATLRTLVDQFSAWRSFPRRSLGPATSIRSSKKPSRSLAAGLKASRCSAISSPTCLLCLPILKPSAALSPT
jgi:two-component system, NtrC family, nitrogen regulation sensor histidine kinase NtrY